MIGQIPPTMKESDQSPVGEDAHADQNSPHRLRTSLHERIQRIGLPPGEDLPMISSDFSRRCHTNFEICRFSDVSHEVEHTDDPEKAGAATTAEGNVWIHVTGIHSAEKLRAFGKSIGLHPLTIEDVMCAWTRPRVEINQSELFFTGRAVGLDPTGTLPKGQQISIVLRDRTVVSFAENEEDVFRPVKTRMKVEGSRIRTEGSSFLTYALIDVLVDRLLVLTEAIEEIVVGLEEAILEEAEDKPIPVDEIYRKKRLVLRLNRLAFPLRDAIHDLHDLSPEVMAPSMDVFLRDLLDHSRRAAERVEHARGMLHDLQDFHAARQDQRINRTMRLLTVIGTIFVPLTFVAGVYGMNFNPEASPWNMPLLNSPYGYPICLAGMTIFAGVMVLFFRRKGWL